MRFLIFAGLRSARRRGGTGQKTEWQPITKIIWLFFIFAIPIQMGGTARAVALTILGLCVLTVIGGLVYGLGHAFAHRNDKPAEPDRIAEYFANQEESDVR